MVADFNRLMNFTNSLSADNMWERNITQACYSWVGNISADITEDYCFFVSYVFNQFGIAVDAMIAVEVYRDNKWEKCGVYSALQAIAFNQLACYKYVEQSQVSTKESQPVSYYVGGYYQTGYYL